ncbi:YcaO-like family protein [Streptomyces lichenis]|uniref:YcaO-like family protein n=1 Tax=Streptomyces lichenis TaxID=2306967 RepID=UPI0027E2B437|nr:YcaO-like family protein [Streptomyces lichenis]
MAYLWCEDHLVVFAGAGCHPRPGIALTWAVSEAAQSRRAAIAGTRDNLPTEPAPAQPARSRSSPRGPPRGRRPSACRPGHSAAPSPTKCPQWPAVSSRSPGTSRWPWTSPGIRPGPSTPCR